MEELEREYLISYYDERVRLLGETPGALGWTSKGQIARYGAALEMFGARNLASGASLADYGCGMGDFYGFLLGNGVSMRDRYNGFDINQGLLDIARRRYPGVPFALLDIDLAPLPRQFDFSLICGVFNQRLEGAIPAAKRCIEKVWAHTKKALYFDALSTKTNPGAGGDISLQYWGPRDLFDFAQNKNALPESMASVFEVPAGESLVLFLERD